MKEWSFSYYNQEGKKIVYDSLVEKKEIISVILEKLRILAGEIQSDLDQERCYRFIGELKQELEEPDALQEQTVKPKIVFRREVRERALSLKEINEALKAEKKEVVSCETCEFILNLPKTKCSVEGCDMFSRWKSKTVRNITTNFPTKIMRLDGKIEDLGGEKTDEDAGTDQPHKIECKLTSASKPPNLFICQIINKECPNVDSWQYGDCKSCKEKPSESVDVFDLEKSPELKKPYYYAMGVERKSIEEINHIGKFSKSPESSFICANCRKSITLMGKPKFKGTLYCEDCYDKPKEEDSIKNIIISIIKEFLGDWDFKIVEMGVIKKDGYIMNLQLYKEEIKEKWERKKNK